MPQKIRMEEITPELAAKWLANTPDYQRKIDPKQVAKLVFAIQRNEWKENGATIVFNENGELLDGQHRLTAIRDSGKTLSSLIVRGVPKGEETFNTIGDEKPRRVTDFLHCKYATVVSAVLRIYWFLTIGIWPTGHGGGGGGHVAPIADVLRISKRWQDKISPLIEPMMPAGRVLGNTSYCVFLVFYHTHVRPVDQPEGINEFFARVGDGVGLKATDPAYKLRQRFISGPIDRHMAHALIIKALYMHLDGLPCGRLSWGAGEEFPPLRGYKKDLK